MIVKVWRIATSEVFFVGDIVCIGDTSCLIILSHTDMLRIIMYFYQFCSNILALALLQFLLLLLIGQGIDLSPLITFREFTLFLVDIVAYHSCHCFLKSIENVTFQTMLCYHVVCQLTNISPAFCLHHIIGSF